MRRFIAAAALDKDAASIDARLSERSRNPPPFARRHVRATTDALASASASAIRSTPRMSIVERIRFVALVAAAVSAGLTIAFVVGVAAIVWLSA
jgi:hypothetical protein